MGHGPRAILAGGLGLTAAFVVACGSQNGLLASNQANNLQAQLGSVSSAVSAGDCGAATGAARAFGNEVSNLPRDVNQTLVRNLGQGAVTVSELAARDCSTTTKSKTTSSSSTTSSTTVTNPTTTTVTAPTTSTVTNPPTSTATNPSPPSTSTNPNGGAGLPGSPSGGAGAGNGKP